MLGEAAAADEHDFEIYLDQVDTLGVHVGVVWSFLGVLNKKNVRGDSFGPLLKFTLIFIVIYLFWQWRGFFLNIICQNKIILITRDLTYIKTHVDRVYILRIIITYEKEEVQLQKKHMTGVQFINTRNQPHSVM